MLMRRAPRFLSLTLALLLGLTTVAAGHARGQTEMNGTYVVLCSGGGLVQVALDVSGEPTGPSHLCPDLVIGLLAALDLPAPVIAPPTGAARLMPAPVVRFMAGQDVPSPAARDPPQSV